MKSKFLLKVLLPIVLFLTGNVLIAQTITTTGTLVAVNTTYGTASAETSFTVEGPGTLFTNDILVTAPTGYEVSLTSGSGFGATVTAPLAINTVPLVTVYVRLKADATVLGGPYAGNIVLTSTGALNTPHNVATVSSTVSPKAITISAPTIAPKVYDGTTAAGVVALGTVTGLVGAEALTITPSATAYSSANVGAAYTSTVSYAIADGTGLAANYSALANDNLTGLSITQKLLTVTANAASKLHGAVLVNPTVGSTAFSSTGLVSGETIGSVTLSYSGGVDTAGAPLGVYAGTIFPSAPVGGTFLLSNYAFVPAPGTMTIIPNTNAYLSNLVSSTGALNTAFNRNDIDYETYVLIAVNSLTVTPTTENQYATVQVRINNTGFSPEPYVTVASGAASPVMTLQEGDNMIDITVTAEDGVTIINYRIKVSREASWVSGGGGGGLESRSLGDAIAKRIFNKAINSENGPVDYSKLPQVQFSDVRNRVQGTEPSSISLTSIMPDITSKGYVAYNSSPKDLTSITNAKEVLAFDFTANKEVKAVAFATKTLGELYDHTKPICDRLKGATLLGVETVKVQGLEFIKYSIKNENGQKEYATSFTVGTKTGRPDFSLQSIYLTQDYANDETMYNFQLWAGSTSLVTDMVADILTKIKAIAPVNVIKSSVLPTTYVESGKREGQNINLVVKNATPNTSGYFKLEDKATETAASSVVRNIPFTINANGKSNVIIPMDDKYESTMTMYVGGEVKDVVYMSDGTWAVDYNKATTVLSSFTVTNDSKRSYTAEEYPLFRNVELKANSSDFVSVVKLLRGGGATADLTGYKGLKFSASGGYNLHVTLVKNGIVDYRNQYAADVQLELGQQDYYVSLDNFKSASTSAKIDAKDITSIIFTVEVGTGRNSQITTTIANVAFTKEDLNYLSSLEAKELALYPNPVTGNRITVNFSSAKAAELSLRVTDMSGKVITLKQVQAVKGMNTVQVPVSTGLKAVHIVSLDGADMKYQSKKVMITN
ncbi:MAG TPA: cadherin-like beta sandwich domain-containing protein [Sediminibacterium sp.]|nr:cadherin-like beta sandwich domain-containing protein [Sediminibacterium sp.]